MVSKILSLFTASFFESALLILLNIVYTLFSIVISANFIFPLITFLFTMLLVLSRFKVFIEQKHKGSIWKWLKWFLKKN